jgi:hypothetical protein
MFPLSVSLLDNRVYDAKGYFVEDASQFKTLFEVFGEAIRKHQQIGFLYKGEPRVVEPYKLFIIMAVGIWQQCVRMCFVPIV